MISYNSTITANSSMINANNGTVIYADECVGGYNDGLSYGELGIIDEDKVYLILFHVLF